MSKKYNLILGHSSDGYILVYIKAGHGDVTINCVLPAYSKNILLKSKYLFTQDEIDKLKASLPTQGMRAVVDASKVEVKEPLYYMQTKRKDAQGERLFFALGDEKSVESTHTFRRTSIENLYLYDHSILRPKSEWEPYLTPDRELVKYEPEGN